MRAGCNVACRCACRHHGVIDATKAYRWFVLHQWPTALPLAIAHFRCSRCRGSHPVTSATWAAPSWPRWGPQTDAEWKRLHRELRG